MSEELKIDDIYKRICAITNEERLHLILNRPIDFKYRREIIGGRIYYFGEDGFAREALIYEPVNPGAFAGREKIIELIDGTKFDGKTRLWHTGAWKNDDEEIINAAHKTMKQLEECFIFFGGVSFVKAVIDEWLDKNQAKGEEEYKELEKRIRRAQGFTVK